MKTLTMTLFPEGATDARFLTALIPRVVVAMLHERGRQELDVLPPRVVFSKKEKRLDKIVDVAEQAYGSHLLLIHADADSQTAVPALRERIQPGVEKVLQSVPTHELCRHIVPIVPIHMQEAWLLADGEMLCDQIGTNVPLSALSIPAKPHQIETLADPKTELKRIVDQATESRSRRRRPFDIGSLYTPLGERIDLTKLGKLPAYQQFWADLAKALADLHLIFS